jgi:hypothetical protein
MQPEASELETGKLLCEARSVLEREGRFLDFLNGMPFTARTAYRRIKIYERAMQMWPEEVVDAAIARRLPLIGWSPEKPLGVYEDIPAPPRNLTPQKIEEFLQRAEMEARRRASQRTQKTRDPRAALRSCFQFIAKNTQFLSSLPEDERMTFLADLVGLEMTLFGAEDTQKFEAVRVPQDFWSSRGGGRSAEARARISEAATRRWERVREAKEEAESTAKTVTESETEKQ